MKRTNGLSLQSSGVCLEEIKPPASASEPLKSPYCKFTLQQMPSYRPGWDALSLHQANGWAGLWLLSQCTYMLLAEDPGSSGPGRVSLEGLSLSVCL